MNSFSPNTQNRLGNITSNIQNKITNLPSIVKNNFNNAAQVIDNGYNIAKTNISNGLSNFNKQSNVGFGSTQQFLSSNTIIAKFAFIILVIIVFLFLLSLGVKLIEYFSTPLSNPMISPGLTQGSVGKIVHVDPSVSGSIPIQRSNNQHTGLEFTWSLWIFMSGNGTGFYQHIFNKGTQPDSIIVPDGTKAPGTQPSETHPPIINNGIAKVNGPGVYIATDSSLYIVMDSTDGSHIDITVPNIPYNKWFHVAIRAENTILDVYINGKLSERQISSSVPKQNFYDIYICQNGGFVGQLSNLQYYSSALSVIQINNIVFWGPNLYQANLPSYNTTDYLSSAWYATDNYPNSPPQI